MTKQGAEVLGRYRDQVIMVYASSAEGSLWLGLSAYEPSKGPSVLSQEKKWRWFHLATSAPPSTSSRNLVHGDFTLFGESMSNKCRSPRGNTEIRK